MTMLSCSQLLTLENIQFSQVKQQSTILTMKVHPSLMFGSKRILMTISNTIDWVNILQKIKPDLEEGIYAVQESKIKEYSLVNFSTFNLLSFMFTKLSRTVDVQMANFVITKMDSMDHVLNAVNMNSLKNAKQMT